ncbi:MAG: competence/damage-inducible protein A [Acidobacteriota bacterium]
MQAEIIAVGSELLGMGRPETNSLYLASRLLPLGFVLRRKSVVGDEPHLLQESLALAIAGADLILLTGGLGPTEDDVTREAVAGFLGRRLREDPELVAQLQRRYRRFGLRMSENNRRQAQVPEGARILPNPVGTAPGLALEAAGRWIILLPGPPRELRPMVEDHVIPLLQEVFPVRPRPLRILKVAGEPESAVDQRVAPLYRREAQVATTILSSPGIVSLYFLWKGEDPREGEEKLERLVGAVREELGEAVYAEREETLAEALGTRLRRLGLSLAAAESCTGGWVGKLVTDVPGSSDYFRGGVVSYSNEAKMALLGVPAEVLEREGAVSAAVAEAMAAGARRAFAADVAVSATGIAGPGGGSDEKPVGTVYLGLAVANRVRSRRCWFPGDREAVRLRTAHLLLDWVRRECDALVRGGGHP